MLNKDMQRADSSPCCQLYMQPGNIHLILYTKQVLFTKLNGHSECIIYTQGKIPDHVFAPFFEEHLELLDSLKSS